MLASSPAPLTPIAGGTDLFVSWHQRPHDDVQLLDLSGLRELQSLKLADDYLQLGGLTTYWDVMSSRQFSAAFPLLTEAARQVGAIQIQTRGTWAGNIANASPAADGVPVLMAYEAVVTLQSRRGARDVPLDEFYLGYKQTARRPDELIVAIRMARRARRTEFFHKVGARAAQAIAKLGVAGVRDDQGWRIVANSVAPYVCRCRNLEGALNAGRAFVSPDEIAEVLRGDIHPIDDIRSTAEYRQRVLSRILFFRFTAPS
jgi:carbon-monoxide dehydrogenase small subunit/xanthine dehydrogenase small subunit